MVGCNRDGKACNYYTDMISEPVPQNVANFFNFSEEIRSALKVAEETKCMAGSLCRGAHVFACVHNHIRPLSYWVALYP